ncbi:hypothetical protein B0A55_00140 [Friedmanniomyces simplex]|uniref:Uncharacterized protein n=1 Tax=Friedmanniomyces simplex TaxID=329884 RepID=A0A4V6WLD8_9PEZI|nr:hypothetical protein B0A55_00140 [Friedmanniomyces simplex]
MDQGSLSRTRSRGISFRSDKSAGSKGKVDHTESPEDKSRRDSIWKNSSKANPNAALNELTPGALSHAYNYYLLLVFFPRIPELTMTIAVSEEAPRGILADVNVNKVLNLTEQSTLQSLREYRHKDVNGNPIVDPDLSNPTRPRLERPLDTIRSFEKAIDNGYKRRSSYMASQSYDQNGQYASRRSSYLGQDAGPSPGRHSAAGGGGGYYGGSDRRPDSYHQGPPRQRYGSRVVSDGAVPRPYGGGGGGGGQHGYHQSGDTVNTGVTNGSDSTGPWASGTDPSSENSSIDRNLAGVQGGNYNGNYNGNGNGNGGVNGGAPNGNGNGYGYGSPTIQEDRVAGPYAGGPVRAPSQQGQGQWQGQGQGQGQSQGQGQGQGQSPRRPIPLGNSGDPPIMPAAGGKLPSSARMEVEKKKGGWLKRRFSKKE